MGQLPGSLARLNTGSKARCAAEGWTEGGEHTLNLCLVLQGWCHLWSQGSILHRAKHLAYIQANTLSSKLQNAPVTSEAISSKDEEVKAASQQQPCDAFAKLQHVPESFEHTLLSPMSFTSPEFTLHLTCTACVHSHCLYSEQGTALWWGAERAANFSCTPWERRRGHSPHADSPRHTSDLQLQVAGCLQIALSQCSEGLSPFIYSYLIRDELSEPGAAFHWVFRGALVSGVSTWGQEVPIRCLARGCALLSASPPREVQTISFLFIRFMLSACRESQAKGIEKQKSGISCLRLSHSCSSPLTPAILCIHRLADRHKKPTVGRAASCEPSRVSMVRSFPLKKQIPVCRG